jgi:hypothetical protein
VRSRKISRAAVLSGPVVRNAPFSAEATTVVRQTLGDGTRIERRGNARYYRDSDGRVRVEQTIIGLEPVNGAVDPQIRVTIHSDPSKPVAYTLDPVRRVTFLGPRGIFGLAVGGGETFAVPLGGVRFLQFSDGRRQSRLSEEFGRGGHEIEEEMLGSRTFSGVEAIGRRLTTTIPTGLFGNDRPLVVVDERWESPELKLLVYSRHSDPRTGVVEYVVSNIRRGDPPPELFVLPADYTLRTDPSELLITLEPALKKEQRK